MPDSPAAPADPELAGLVGGAAAGAAAGSAAAARASSNPVPPSRPVKRPTVSSTRSKTREPDGPSWEEQRRHEAYPSIKARAGVSSLPNVPTVAIVAGGVLVAAIALFFLPALLGVGGPDTPTGASPTPSAAASTAAPTPTPVPEPTAQVYVIKAGDTLSAIAREFNVSLDALLAANKDTISNPNRIKVGDEIIIPLPETTEPPAEPSEASAAPSAT
jgi:LysM repeat protein